MLITLLCGALGWSLAQMKWVKDRREALQWLETHKSAGCAYQFRWATPRDGFLVTIGKRDMTVDYTGDYLGPPANNHEPVPLPWAVQLFGGNEYQGGNGVSVIILFSDTLPDWRTKKAELERLFPESAFEIVKYVDCYSTPRPPPRAEPSPAQ